ncbi:polyprenyl synthetase family protein, partial [Streptomyces sp. 2MCAF27]
MTAPAPLLPRPTTTTPPVPASAAQTLARCRGLVLPALTAAVERLHPYPGEMAAFSFGWCEVGGT